MAKLRHSVDIDTLKVVYYSLVHSYIRYGLVTWGSASSSTLSPLYTALHKVLRIMTFAPYGNIDLKWIQFNFNFMKVLFLKKGKRYMDKRKKITTSFNYISKGNKTERRLNK